MLPAVVAALMDGQMYRHYSLEGRETTDLFVA